MSVFFRLVVSHFTLNAVQYVWLSYFSGDGVFFSRNKKVVSEEIELVNTQSSTK